MFLHCFLNTGPGHLGVAIRIPQSSGPSKWSKCQLSHPKTKKKGRRESWQNSSCDYSSLGSLCFVLSPVLWRRGPRRSELLRLLAGRRVSGLCSCGGRLWFLHVPLACNKDRHGGPVHWVLGDFMYTCLLIYISPSSFRYYYYYYYAQFTGYRLNEVKLKARKRLGGKLACCET